jgi:hypothetical protein
MKRKRSSGQSLVEFALIFPMLLVLLLGFLDLGRVIFYYSSLTNAVREGTRRRIVTHTYLAEAEDGTDLYKLPCSAEEPADPLNDTLRCIVYRRSIGLSQGLDPATGIVFVITTNAKDDTLYEPVQITANYCFNPVTPGVQLLFSSTCNGKKGVLLTAQSRMYVAPVAR